MPNAIILVVDRFGTGYLGPYGNTWLDTPSLNRLASESVLFEFMQTDSPHLATVYRSYWHGVHGACNTVNGPSLPQELAGGEVHTCLLTDDVEVAGLGRDHGFDEVLDSTVDRPLEPCDAIEQTQLAQLFASAIDWLDDAPEPFLLWIHARGMNGPWDAPTLLRRQFAGEDDPLPPDLVIPPQARFDDDADPDELLGFQHAYAGQVILLDLCLGILLDRFKSNDLDESTLLAFTSPRGYPLGEHGIVGSPLDGNGGEPLLGELLQVPCILRTPHPTRSGVREHTLTQPPDICATLRAWWDLQATDLPRWGRDLLAAPDGSNSPSLDRVLSIAGNHAAIRTPAWFMHTQPDGKRQLYAKPDDRWEANEVSERCPDVAELMAEATRQTQDAAKVGQKERLEPLPEILVEG